MPFTSAKISRPIGLYADSPPSRSIAGKSVDPATSNLISERERRVTGTRYPRRELRPRSPYWRCIRSLFPGEGNHIPRSTVMVNERSLRAVTEPLPPTPRLVGPVGAPSCKPIPSKPNSYVAAIIARPAVISESNGSPDRYRYHLVFKRGQGGLAFELDLA